MGFQFDWQIDDSPDSDEIRPIRPTPPWLKWGLSAALAFILLSFVGSLWWRVYSAETALRQSVQHVLDLEQQAYLAQDGDLFFSVFDSAETAFLSTQLRPDQQRFHQTVQLVTKAEQHNNIIWANTTSVIDGETYQRVAFFEQLPDGTRHIATDPAYWGETVDTVRSWGTLKTFEADTQWINQLDQTIAATINSAPLALGETIEDRIFIVVIRDDFAISPIPQIIYYPSPRIVGLDADGQPSATYWAGLQTTIAAQVAPVKLRFALPDYIVTDGVPIFMRQAAADFAAQYPPGRISIEFVTAESLSADPMAWIADVDGALLQTTSKLVKSGAVYDLTNIASLDREFDQGDFYAQSWRAAWWDDRMWFVPWSTSLNLLYFNTDLLREHGVTLPQADWTWTDIEAALKQIELAEDTDRAFIDPTRDMLYAMAYSNGCSSQGCIQALSPDTAAIALEWYRQGVEDKALITNLATLQAEARERAIMGTLSAHKQVAMWVGAPVDYEYQVGLQSMRVLPFLEISAETPLKMPLHIHGHVMSSYTDQPFWTWQWLKYLSYQAPPSRLRHIPARPSVARQSGFWEWLPTPIADAYKQVLPNARPILIGEENYFTWQQLARASQAPQITPQVAQPASTKWFSNQ